MHLCRADYRRFCNGIHPGGGRIINCLESHSRDLSDPCSSAMPQAEELVHRALAAGVLPQ